MLEILFNDQSIIAINKPARMLVHRTKMDKDKVFAMQTLRDQIGQHVFPIHRLDKPTSGVLLFAKNSEVAAKLSELFVSKDIKKEYLAIVRGYLNGEELIDYPLRRILDKFGDKDRRKVDEEPQEAKTQYKGLNTIEIPIANGKYQTSRYSFVKLTPLTGRKHQLRRHMKHVSHPIIGDRKHGKAEHNNLFRDTFETSRLLLHAYSLSFTHPITQKEISIKAPLDQSFQNILKRFNWSADTF
ncbi:MAG: tRNA pseudouridine(65) synthase TruC [Campylobacterales bacterium]|nr:tRNA pseudouridine(65) synthase TruC [Campylobacterales bacterium]